jgi:hypothetical protein
VKAILIERKEQIKEAVEKIKDVMQPPFRVNGTNLDGTPLMTLRDYLQ